jgi:hypothetical protein
MFSAKSALLLTILFFIFTFSAEAEFYAQTMPETDIIISNGSLFPHIFFSDTINRLKTAESSLPYWVSTLDESNTYKKLNDNQISILLNNDILAFYGHPNSRNMGILGRYSIEELDKLLGVLCLEYAEAGGGRQVRKAFYLIYGTVWPEGEIGIMNEALVKRYIEYALEKDILVFLDHQIGRYDPIDSLKRLLPWLRYPNVHLALDPEWRTTQPMKVIGSVTAAEVNRAQQVMEDYIIENNIPGERMLVIHQFNYIMIRNRESVKSDFNRVRLVHCSDGFGPPHLKRQTYAYNAEASNIPVKGFKLFYNFGIPGAGYDNPLLTPKEVYSLNPRPYIIMYQ